MLVYSQYNYLLVVCMRFLDSSGPEKQEEEERVTLKGKQTNEKTETS